MKMIWLNFYDVRLNTLREIKLSFKKWIFWTLIWFRVIQVVCKYIKKCKEVIITVDFLNY